MKKNWIPQFIASLLLLWAFNPVNPYGYYVFLRLVCCVVFAYLAFQAFSKQKHGWGWAFVVTALLYNPIIRVNLSREIWSVINVLTIGFAVASVFMSNTNEQEPPAT